jgi:lysophospholipase L1-like esterase
MDIQLDQGSSVNFTFTLRNSQGDAFDLTGCDIHLQVRQQYGDSRTLISASLANGRIDLVNASQGVFALRLHPGDTTSIRFPNKTDDSLEAVYDVEVTTPTGLVLKPFRGTLTVNREVTKEPLNVTPPVVITPLGVATLDEDGKIPLELLPDDIGVPAGLEEQINNIEVVLSTHVDDESNPHAVTKAQVGLANADNTSDANKPVSTATQAALNTKVSAGQMTVAINAARRDGRVLISQRGSIACGGTSNVGGTGTQVEQVYRYTASEDCSSLEVVFSNQSATSLYVFSTGLADMSVRCGFKLVAAGLGVQGCTATGATDLPVKVGGTGSLFFNVSLAAGAQFFLVWLITYASPPSNFALGLAAAASGESNAQGTGLTDRTGNGFLANLNPSNFAFAPPVAIKAIPLQGSNRPRFLIVGDSIASGGGNDGAETIRGTRFTGWLQRALNDQYAWSNYGMAGQSLIGLDGESIAVRAMRDSVAFGHGITHAVQCLGTNDTASSATPEETVARLAALVERLRLAGIRSILVTVAPRTNAANTSEALAGYYAKRAGINAGIVALAATLGLPLFDISALWTDSTNPILWRTDLGSPTTDGVHPGPVLHTLAKDAFVTALPTLIQ